MNNKNDIKDNTINNNCSRCGECCGAFIPFNRSDINIIKQYITKNNIKPVQRITNKDLKVLCPFYNMNEHKCNIYEVRPFVCQDFICSRKNWKERRDYYSSISEFNGTDDNNTQLVSFDDVIYDDYSFTLHYILALAIQNNINETNDLIRLFISCRRLDLLQYFQAVDDKGVTVNGTILLEKFLNNKYTYSEYIKLHPELLLQI